MKSTGERYSCRTCGRYIVGRTLKNFGDTIFPFPHLRGGRECEGVHRPVIRNEDYPVLRNFWSPYKVLGVEILEGGRHGIEGVNVRYYTARSLGSVLGAVIAEHAVRLREQKTEAIR